MSKYSVDKHPRVIIKKGKAKPFWYHHPWVFSGAIKDIRGVVTDGEVVEVVDNDRKFLGKGFFNSQSQIRVRLLSWDRHQKIDYNFFQRQIRHAIKLREKLQLRAQTSAYRLIHSEGDGLPGLTVDRYNNFLVAQFLSAGMDRRREMLLDILRRETGAKTIVERYPARYRSLEGLEEIDYLVHGSPPPEKIVIREYGLSFNVNLAKGQKTGFYIDQRDNRRYLTKLCSGKRVLDAFCYSGAFGIHLLATRNIDELVFMDSSSLALKLVEENLAVNKLPRSKLLKANIFKKLSQMQQSGEFFDCIILDPPKVAPDRANLQKGLHSLRTINAIALRMLSPAGILVTCDCSGVISRNDLLRVLSEAAKDSERSFRIIDFRGAGPDHPIAPACLESSYLKMVVGVVG